RDDPPPVRQRPVRPVRARRPRAALPALHEPGLRGRGPGDRHRHPLRADPRHHLTPPPFRTTDPERATLMSPLLFSADHAALDQGAARAVALVPVALSISDLFAEYAAASRAGRAAIRLAADASLLAELDGFDYPAAA